MIGILSFFGFTDMVGIITYFATMSSNEKTTEVQSEQFGLVRSVWRLKISDYSQSNESLELFRPESGVLQRI